MPEGFQVDLDSEQVLFDGTWYSKDDLAHRIKAMVDGGDYRVSRPSAALEALQNALLGLRSLTLRLPAEQADALAAEAARQGLPVGAFARELLIRSLPAAPSAFSSGPAASVAVAPAPLPSPLALTSEVPSPLEVATAIPLTNRRREETDLEKDWFKKR
jgi:hypothetical protein